VQVKNAFLHSDRIDAEDISSQYDTELNQNHQQHEPPHHDGYHTVYRIQAIRDGDHSGFPKNARLEARRALPV